MTALMAERQMPEGMRKFLASPLMKYFTLGNTVLYRVSGGRLGGTRGGAPVLLLTATGRKSGRKITTPLIYLRNGAEYVVVASKGGYDKHPLWYLNLLANPASEVQVGGTKLATTARVANASERERLWPRLLEIYADYANYQSWTDREIPLVILSPRAS
jgi:F420H(2)-dependent quinone reductase